MPWPKQIKYDSATRTLMITYDDGSLRQASAFHLRVNSPSAEVQGHGGERPPAPMDKENVSIAAMEPVGNYAVRLVFDDGHNSGLFTWQILHELSEGVSS